MVTLENWIFKSNFYLVSLEFSGSCDWKIELREVGRHPKGQLVESWPSLHSRYNFPIHRCAKGTRPVLKKGPTQDFPVVDDLAFERGAQELCKTLWEFSLWHQGAGSRTSRTLWHAGCMAFSNRLLVRYAERN